MKDERYIGETAFCSVFRWGHFQIVNLFIEKSGVSLDSLIEEINEYKYYFISNAETTVAYFQGLSKYPEILFVVDKAGRTPLQIAYINKQIPVVDLYLELLGKHPEFWEVECRGESTIFDEAVKREDTSTMQKVVDALKDKKELLFERGMVSRGLEYAAVHTNLKVGTFLLQIGSRKGGTICRADSRGETFIHFAARRGFAQLLEQYMKDRGISELLRKNIYNEAPLQIAVTELLTIMKSNPEQIEQFLRTISFLFDLQPAGVHPFLLEDTSYTPFAPKTTIPKTILHTACSIGCLPIVERFLKEAIDSDIKAQSLFTEHPLTIAVENDQEHIIALYMVKDTKNVGAQNRNRTNTPFQRAFELRKTKIIEQFFTCLEKDPTTLFMKQEDGKTVLHFACKGGHVDIIKKCIKVAGDDIRFLAIQDNDGNTPLHLIPYSDMAFDLIDKLRGRQDLLFQQNKKGESCLHMFAAHDLKRAKDRIKEFADKKYLLLKNGLGQIAEEVAIIKPKKKSDEGCSIS